MENIQKSTGNTMHLKEREAGIKQHSKDAKMADTKGQQQDGVKFLEMLMQHTLLFLSLLNQAMIQKGYSRQFRKQAFNDFIKRGLVDGNLFQELQKLVDPVLKERNVAVSK